MVHKQSVHGRMAQLSMANIDAIVDRAEDPAACLNELIESFTEVIEQAHALITKKVGKLRLAEADHAEDVAASVEWEHEARRAHQLARDATEAHEDVTAQQLISLATYAAGRKVSFEAWARQSGTHIAAQSARVQELRGTLTELEHRLSLLRARSEEVSRHDGASKTEHTPVTSPSVNVFDPTSELSRFRERVQDIGRTMG